MADHVQCYQRITFTKEFEETLIRFRQMIVADAKIKETIRPEYAEKGLFSAAVRYLIKIYVDDGWAAFNGVNEKQLKEEAAKQKLKEEVQFNAAT